MLSGLPSVPASEKVWAVWVKASETAKGLALALWSVP